MHSASVAPLAEAEIQNNTIDTDTHTELIRLSAKKHREGTPLAAPAATKVCGQTRLQWIWRPL